MQLNHAQRELALKLVYYGPGLSGKTTNLQQLHARSQKDACGRLLTVETHDDRTLFFDLLPVFFDSPSGYKVKVKLFTVPGQVIHNATRRVVLQNADGVAFIADSRREATAENNAYWKNLDENMRENGLELARGPAGDPVQQVRPAERPHRRGDRGGAAPRFRAGDRRGRRPRRGRAGDVRGHPAGRVAIPRGPRGRDAEHRALGARAPGPDLRTDGLSGHVARGPLSDRILRVPDTPAPGAAGVRGQA